MITNVTNLISTHGSANDLKPLVEQLAKRADLNRDGQVSKAEFAEFLQNLLDATHTTAERESASRRTGPDQ